MKIWYSPCKTGIETQIVKFNENTISVNKEEYEFDINSVVFPDIAEQTKGMILEAHRENGELFVKIFRGYLDSCPWDTGTYQEII